MPLLFKHRSTGSHEKAASTMQPLLLRWALLVAPIAADYTLRLQTDVPVGNGEVLIEVVSAQAHWAAHLEQLVRDSCA